VTNHHNDVNEWFCFSSPETMGSLVFFSCRQWSWISSPALFLILIQIQILILIQILIQRHSQILHKYHLPSYSCSQMTPLSDIPLIQSLTHLHSPPQMLSHRSRYRFSHLQILRTFISLFCLWLIYI